MKSALVGCIAEGKPVACTIADGREALRAVLASTASASTNRPISMVDAPAMVTAVSPPDTGSRAASRRQVGA